MAWTEERVEKLKTLWAEGVTAAEIAKALGDVSRNAVIGKAHRLGLSNRAASHKGAETKPEEPCELKESSSKKREAANSASEATAAPVDSAAADEKADATAAKSAKRGRSKAAAAPEEPARPAAEAARLEPSAEVATVDGALEPIEEFDVEEADEDVINPIVALAAEAERNARKLSLLELNERTCKWPIGDPSTDDFFFCGLPCAPEKPYCSAHVQVAYQPMSSRRDRERSRARAATA